MFTGYGDADLNHEMLKIKEFVKEDSPVVVEAEPGNVNSIFSETLPAPHINSHSRS